MADSDRDFVHVQESGTGAVLLLLHGTGGNELDLLAMGRAIAPNAAMLSPRGKVLENGMPRFFRRLAEGVFDLEDLHLRTAELGDWLERKRSEPDLAGLPIIAVGFSNGANMAGSLLLSRAGLLSGAVLFRPMVPYVPELAPNLAGSKVLIGAGRQDQLIPQTESERLAELLTGYGAQVDLYWRPGGHGLDQGDLDAARNWFARQFG